MPGCTAREGLAATTFGFGFDDIHYNDVPNASSSGATPAAARIRLTSSRPRRTTPGATRRDTFPHDHVVRSIPAGNHGTYSTKLQGFFVVCSGDGIVSGSCVPSWTNVGGPDPLPFATTVNGRPLTSASAIESAAAAGLVVPINLGPSAVIVGSISGN